MELIVLLAIPLLGAAWATAFGERSYAPEANSAFSLATLIAAAALAMRVIGEGSFSAADEQFFIDPFNVFLVTLTAFVGFTTSLFSRPYMRSSSSTAGSSRASCASTTACISCSSPRC